MSATPDITMVEEGPSEERPITYVTMAVIDGAAGEQRSCSVSLPPNASARMLAGALTSCVTALALSVGGDTVAELRTQLEAWGVGTT